MIYYFLDVREDYLSSASYNRVRLFSEGFSEQLIKCKICLLYFSNKRIVKLLFYAFNLIKVLFILLRLTKNDVAIFYDISHYYYLFGLFAKKTNLVVEMTEYPHHIIVENIGAHYKKLSLQNCINYKYASLFVTCSSYLKKFYSEYVKDVYVAPLIVNVNELRLKKRNENFCNYEYLAYCGSFVNNKDGVPNLLEAFSLFHKDYPDIKLVLIGSGDEKSLTEIKAIIEQLNINQSVVMTGALKHEDVLDWLVNAEMLLLARPNNKQAEGGIPSKVGEYLASGVPCVITKTGDLPSYLHDGEDVFLCEPDNIQAFYRRMKDCYEADGKSVGVQGIKASLQFDYIEQASKLASCLKNKFDITLK